MFSYNFFSNRKKCRRLTSVLSFALALITYLLTLEPDASFWDCPEYLVTAANLEVGHPPGNPVWTLTAHMFSLLGGSDPQLIAIFVNASSALFTSLAVGILASCLFLMLHWILISLGSLRRSIGDDRWLNAALSLASAGGALTFGWSDSPWFSAVEAEVYAMSLFLTALSVRLMLGWAFRHDRAAARRKLLLIVYLTGLSIGVHQLNLLVLPALGLIWLFRRYPGRGAGFGRIVVTLLIAMGAVGVILLLFMPGVIKCAAMSELLFVNTFGLPFGSGVIAFWTLAMALCWLTPPLLERFTRINCRWLMILWVPAMLLTGYSSYMIILVRASANPPMNEGAPSDMFSLAYYLGREQYGSTPLFYGRTPHSKPLRLESIRPDGSADYSRLALRDKGPRYAAVKDSATGRDRYVEYGRRHEYVYTPELNMLLPRLTSSNPADISCYADWAGMTAESMKEVEVSYALDSLGNPVGKLAADGSRVREKELRPTYWQQIRYLITYQVGYMYFRYLMWNYSGRQNDRFATGEAEHGNFITGFPFIDDAMLGPQSALPDELGSENPGRNRYFMIPLLLGIIGMLALSRWGRRGERANTVILLLFLMTGVAIVLYLNQSPREARERDYSFLGSFWAYALWIGAGMLSLILGALKMWFSSGWRRELGIPALGVALLLAIGLPLWMLSENYDDHDRSGRRGVTDYATNILDSLEPNAILFTNGDNYTFPLWWAQEVAGVRRDVTIVNTAYLTTAWYIRGLMAPAYEREGLGMQADAAGLCLGHYDFTAYEKSPVTPLREDTLRAEDALTALKRRYASADYVMPSMLRLPAQEGGDSIYIRTSAVASASSRIGLRQLAALDIIATNAASGHPRPIYWQAMLPSSDYAGVYPFTTRTLHTRRLVYADSITPGMRDKLLTWDFTKALETRSGNTIGPDSRRQKIYVDDTFGNMMSGQRLGLLRLGGRLLKEKRWEEAAELAEVIYERFPEEWWEYQLINEADSACNEGIDLARLMMEAQRGLTPGEEFPKPLYGRGDEMVLEERIRLKEWREYQKALPPRLRRAVTPKTARKAQLAAYADSLYIDTRDRRREYIKRQRPR